MANKAERKTTESEYVEGSLRVIRDTIRPLIVQLSKTKGKKATLEANGNEHDMNDWAKLNNEEVELEDKIDDAIAALCMEVGQYRIPHRIRNEIIDTANTLYDLFLFSVMGEEADYLVHFDEDAAQRLLIKHKIKAVIYGQKEEEEPKRLM